MVLKTAVDHVSWLFFPSRFLFAGSHPRQHRVIGWETVRFVDSQEEVQAVNKATGDVFLGGGGNAFLEALLGPQSVFLLDHERHRLARRIAGDALTRCANAEYSIDVDRYIDESLDRARSHWVTALGPWARTLTMRAMCKVVMDVEDPATVRLLFRRFEMTTGYSANIVSYSKPLWRRRGAFSIGAVVARIVGRVDQVIYRTIAERRRAGATGKSPLDALIREQEQHGYDDGFIRDNLVAMIAAGYETTGAAIAWMLYWLSRTDAYAGLRAKRAAGDADYLAAFRNECLRFCPPIEILPRKVAHEREEAAVALLPDLAVPGSEGELAMVCPCVHRVHHDPSVYQNPEQFDPARFVDRTYRPSEYMPFGIGRRFCLGASVGQRLMDRVLERLLDRRLKFELRPSSFRPVRRNVIIWPGAFLYARLRQDGESTS
jgi:cytochrome P450